MAGKLILEDGEVQEVEEEPRPTRAEVAAHNRKLFGLLAPELDPPDEDDEAQEVQHDQ